MNNLNDTLPDLMRRATEGLEPQSPDLLDRTVRQGLRLSRRRTTMLSLSGAGAVLATVGLVVGGTQILGQAGSDAAVAGTTGLPAANTSTTATPPTAEENLALLKILLQGRGLKLSRPESWGIAADGYLGAAFVADDGKGAARVDVVVEHNGYFYGCKDRGPGCTILPDGSAMTSIKNQPEYPPGRNVDGVVYNAVEIAYSDGRTVSLTSYNAPQEKGAEHTRAEPLFTVAELTTMAKDTAWTFPPKAPKPPAKGNDVPNRVKPSTR
jgi:hypothetical protein